MCTVLELLCVLFSVMALNFPFNTRCSNEQLKMSYCYLAFRTNVLLNLCCPGHLSYYSPNQSEPLHMYTNSCKQLRTHTHAHTYMHMCVHTHAHIQKHTLTHTQTNRVICTHTNTRTKHTHLYTHTHTRAHAHFVFQPATHLYINLPPIPTTTLSSAPSAS